MKKYLGLALIFGWFFAYKAPAGIEEAYDLTLSGPYSSEKICKATLEDLKDFVDSVGVKGVEFTKCHYRQET